ncbi:unnamed protein product [Haemonchus placei]|uniref:Subtilisin n=1 Tax=Haemonchus placei TaxID=6290 RepID=A0A0N4W5D3_HAEPC|nr:unnamed protein product [Haemonchus placei]
MVLIGGGIEYQLGEDNGIEAFKRSPFQLDCQFSPRGRETSGKGNPDGVTGLIGTGAAIIDAVAAASVADSGDELVVVVAGDCDGNSNGVRSSSGEDANGFRVVGEYDEPSDEVGEVSSD